MKTNKELPKGVGEAIQWESLQRGSGIALSVARHNTNKKNQLEKKKKIERAFARNWTLHNSDIGVKVSGNVITLSGIVNSWPEKDKAERVAHDAAGNYAVNNELIIEHAFSLAE